MAYVQETDIMQFEMDDAGEELDMTVGEFIEEYNQLNLRVNQLEEELARFKQIAGKMYCKM